MREAAAPMTFIQFCLPTRPDFTHVVVVAESCLTLAMHISARIYFTVTAC